MCYFVPISHAFREVLFKTFRDIVILLITMGKSESEEGTYLRNFAVTLECLPLKLIFPKIKLFLLFFFSFFSFGMIKVKIGLSEFCSPFRCRYFSSGRRIRLLNNFSVPHSHSFNIKSCFVLNL